jgi:predicted nucleotidyltransferase
MDKNEILTILKEHKEEIIQKYKVCKIGLFGSFSENKQKNDSDIDFYVEFKEKSFDNIAGLWNYLENLYHRKIDLIHYHKNINKTILEHIKKRVIYG